MRNVFINVLDGTDDSEFNAMQDEITNIYETARIKHSDKLMKNDTIIGTFTIGISPPENDRVSAFLAVTLTMTVEERCGLIVLIGITVLIARHVMILLKNGYYLRYIIN